MHLSFLHAVFLQEDGGLLGFLGGDRAAFGSDDPMVAGLVAAAFAVAGFGVLLNIMNAAIRIKMVDMVKWRRIMKETRAFNKERMAAYRSQDKSRIDQVNRKSAYMNKLNMEMMQMNLRPMMITFVPLILIFYFVLPHLFSYTVAVSPIPLNVIPGDLFQLTCTAEQAADPDHVCDAENAVFLWAWYFLASIAFSGIIMRLTKTTMDLN